jgi:serine protease
MTLANSGKSFVSRNFLMLLAGVAVASTGCVGEAAAPSENVDTAGMSWEEFQANVFQEPESGVYIVDHDIPVYGIKNLREFYDRNVRDGALIVDTVGGVDDKWSATQKLNLTYCVSSTFGTTNKAKVVAAMASAAAAWASATNIKFVYVPAQDATCTKTNNNVLFDVNPVNAGGQYLARSFFPSTARADRNVLIDGTAFTTGGSPDLTGILRHELGHTIGFRHEHTRPEALAAGVNDCFEDNNWRSLTTYDGSSVMHYPQCNGTGDWSLTLTAKDIAGAAALYGAGTGGTGGAGGGTGGTTGTPSTATASGTVAAGGTVNYQPITVLAGTEFKVAMTGTGDADLYVRFGAAPTTSTYACRPYLTGTAETCTVTVPAGQTAGYIQVRGYAAATYNLAINYTAP